MQLFLTVLTAVLLTIDTAIMVLLFRVITRDGHDTRVSRAEESALRVNLGRP